IISPIGFSPRPIQFARTARRNCLVEGKEMKLRNNCVKGQKSIAAIRLTFAVGCLAIACLPAAAQINRSHPPSPPASSGGGGGRTQSGGGSSGGGSTSRSDRGDRSDSSSGSSSRSDRG